MHAYIITGSTSDERSDRINKLLSERSVSRYDIITIVPEPISIGVDSVRGVAARLSIHPVASPCHAVIVRDAHAMTIEAQNAFLKTLEEPPGRALIILETNQPDALLPTVLSRCHTIRVTSDKIPPCHFEALEQLLESSIGERLKLIDTHARTRDDALAFVNLAITALHPKLRRSDVTKLLRSLLTARTHILGNVNPKLALDALFLSVVKSFYERSSSGRFEH